MGKPKGTFEPGMPRSYAKCTLIFGEGAARKSCTKFSSQDHFNLHGYNPQGYETGIKEIWRVKPEKHQPGRVIHGSLGFPDFFPASFNGMWLYDMKDNLVSVGVRDAARLARTPTPTRTDKHAGASRLHEVHARPPRGRRARPLRREDDSHRRSLRFSRSSTATAPC